MEFPVSGGSVASDLVAQDQIGACVGSPAPRLCPHDVRHVPCGEGRQAVLDRNGLADNGRKRSVRREMASRVVQLFVFLPEEGHKDSLGVDLLRIDAFNYGLKGDFAILRINMVPFRTGRS
jgi:hypothetical protein